jgi:hypothetical protein
MIRTQIWRGKDLVQIRCSCTYLGKEYQYEVFLPRIEITIYKGKGLLKQTVNKMKQQIIERCKIDELKGAHGL